MALATTSTAALSAAGASGTLAMTPGGRVARGMWDNTAPVVPAGTDTSSPLMRVYGPPLLPDRAGAYLIPSDDFRGSFALYRHTAGSQFSTDAAQQRLVQGDQNALCSSGSGALATVTSTDSLTLTLTAWTAGTLTLSVVQ